MRVQSAPSIVPLFSPTAKRQQATSSPADSSGTVQQSSAPQKTNQSSAAGSADPFNLAILLSSQGATILPPGLQLQLHAGVPNSPSQPNSFSTSGVESSAGAPLTAAEEAQQIMDSFGSRGVLTLAEVEQAEGGVSAASGAESLVANTDADIAADFSRLSGGTNKMTLAQLTNAIAQYADPQGTHLNSYGKVMLPGRTVATSTTNNIPNSPTSAAKGAGAQVASQESLFQQETLASAENAR